MSEFRRATTLKFCIHVAAVVALLGSVSPVFSTDKPVRYLSYTNCGAYTVKDVWLNWKDDKGKKEKIKVGSNLMGKVSAAGFYGKNNSICVDLSNSIYDDIPEGNKVWLSYRILWGETKGCTSGNPRVRDSNSTVLEYYKSAGETLTNNRCQRKKNDPGQTPLAGNASQSRLTTSADRKTISAISRIAISNEALTPEFFRMDRRVCLEAEEVWCRLDRCSHRPVTRA